MTQATYVGMGKVYGRPYYQVDLIWTELAPAVLWCREVFGPGELVSGLPGDFIFAAADQRWYYNVFFWFRDKQDLEWFLLRWQ